MPKTAEEIMQRMEQLTSATKRLYEEHRKLMQEFEELKNDSDLWRSLDLKRQKIKLLLQQVVYLRPLALFAQF